MAFWAFLFLALIFHPHPILGMLQCDPTFVKHLDHYLSSKVPKDVPNRHAFLESMSKEILNVYQTSFRDKQYLRIIDIRSVAKLKKMVFYHLRGTEFHASGPGASAFVGLIMISKWTGMNMFLMDITKIKQELISQMKQSLEHFADLACSEDCSVTEGPVLDCWSCLHIRAQCFKGSVCGEKDDLVAEGEEIAIFLSLVVEFVIVSFMMILCYHYYKKKMMLLNEKETKLLRRSKNMQEEIEAIIYDSNHQ